jgi:glycosyltransferase involved in cell wall biosynthesis
MTSRHDCLHTYTVFTPTYNRAALLPRVYECLETQTFRDFEWLVVDDGSTDDTPEVVKTLRARASFLVRYIAKPNGGKPTAVNRGAREAAGFMFAILDSDDWYVPEALERFWYHWQSIPASRQPNFVGVTGLCSLASGELIGSRFPQNVFDSDAIDLRYKYRVRGEKSGILRTAVMQQFQYPEHLGKYVSESLVWNRMANKYKTRFVNEVLTIKDYQPGGITDKGRLIQIRDSQASLLCAKELIGLGNRLPFKPRVRAYSNVIRYSLHQGISLSDQVKCVPSKAMFCLCFLIGAYLRRRDASYVELDRRLR